MAALARPARLAVLPPATLLAPAVVVVVNLFFFDTLFDLFSGDTPETGYLPFHLALLAGLGLVAFLSCAARTLGWSGAGSAAGLLLASLALAARDVSECMLRVGGIDTTIYDEVPGMSALCWIARNVMLVVYGYGLGLVVFTTVVDVVRRRRDPAWAIDGA